MLTTLLWKKLTPKERMRKLEEEYGIPMHREVVEEVSSMCSYSAAIKEQGIAEGRTEGIEKSVCVLLELMGELSEEVRCKIYAESNEAVLEGWLKVAKQAETIQEFCAKACL